MQNFALLQKVLKTREIRAKNQKYLSQLHQNPVLNFSLNMPGAYKESRAGEIIFKALQEALHVKLSKEGLQITDTITNYSLIGFEAIFSIKANALKLKRLCCEIEQNHPLGRFGDLDVIDQDGKTISRKALGLEARRCFLCQKDAKLCARAQSHNIKELYNFIDLKVQEYTNEYSN